MPDYSELRRLLTDKSPDPQTANCRLANAAVDALPGLLEANDRLVHNLALANRCNDELNQSATEYARKFYEANRSIAELEAEVARRREQLERLDAIIKISNWRADRIAQLETARDSLHAAIKHGDPEHVAWLLEAINAHFAGLPVPGPRGQGRKSGL